MHFYSGAPMHFLSGVDNHAEQIGGAHWLEEELAISRSAAIKSQDVA